MRRWSSLVVARVGRSLTVVDREVAGLDAELVALASSAASALVGAMAKNGWDSGPEHPDTRIVRDSIDYWTDVADGDGG
ncbi:hypothetical protein ACFFX1_43995 [Dactylosporangium sucinum]|uniref:Uncharacterized protein n=1 Tax=Dactylosporangium sucinum TaxID=1424081 RepID=A0A917UAW1_9ACTN|nr:hypothetical protein [Dactylosporangium sucinum]GGM73287.1 hypothetical protein GCM10007977_088670 [Dactylosporangium sucinum]